MKVLGATISTVLKEKFSIRIILLMMRSISKFTAETTSPSMQSKKNQKIQLYLRDLRLRISGRPRGSAQRHRLFPQRIKYGNTNLFPNVSVMYEINEHERKHYSRRLHLDYWTLDPNSNSTFDQYNSSQESIF
jgi:hypothetical protein